MNEYEGFTDYDAHQVTAEYVCSICEGDLSVIEQDGRPERLVVCPEHGNVEDIGRITKNTVAIRNANAAIHFRRVIYNLPEFWGVLIPTKAEVEARRNKSLAELGF
jgi:hypothetical protein